MRVTYSIGAKFAGGGIGNTAYHAVQGLYRHNVLRRLLCSTYRPTEIPEELIRAMGIVSRVMRRLALYDATRRISLLHNQLYDRWSALQLQVSDVTHVWGNYGLYALERAKALGSVTIVERASSHPATQTQLLREEHARWELPYRVLPASVSRAVREFEVADYVLIPSEFVRQSFLSQGFPSEKLVRIPFGVDASKFQPAEQRIFDTPFRVLFLGQVSVRKGVLYLLEAWKRLGWTDAQLWIVGRPSRQIQALLAQFQDLPGVSFRGHTTYPVQTFQAADVFAFPTIEEGSALVTYEAMACGLPVVTTPNAGSIIVEGQNGFLVPIRDVANLCAALERLRSNTALRLEMGRAARRSVEPLSWQRYGEAIVKVYQEVLMRGTARE